MTQDLWRLLILLALAVWLAAHDHRLRDNETVIWDASTEPGDKAERLLG